MSKRILCALIVMGGTLAIYLPSVSRAFIPYDDPEYVTENVHMRDGLSVDNVMWAFSSCGYASNWHPLAWISMMADVSVARGRDLSDTDWNSLYNRVAFVMRLHNVILHSMNAVLLFLLIAFLCKGRMDEIWMAVIALFWALHPLRTEAVCWIAERKELLCVTFMLLGIMTYVRQRWITSFVFAALAKPVAVTLPVVLVAWDWVFVRKVRILRVVPFVMLSVLTSWLTMGAQTVAIKCGADWGVPMRLGAIFGSPLVYLRQTFWPLGLSGAYPTTSTINWPLVVCGVVFFLLIVIVSLLWLRVRLGRCGHHSPCLDIAVFLIAWSYIGLVPMLGIVKVGWQEHSDRYTYWVGCGLCVCLAMLLSEKGHEWWKRLLEWIERTDGRPVDCYKYRRGCLVAGCVLALILALVSQQRMKIWRDPFVFMADTLSKCWNVDFANAMALRLVALGSQYEAEAERWMRLCAKENPCDRSYILLARFLLRKESREPSVDVLGSRLPYAEAEMLIQSVLGGNPNNQEAKELLDSIIKARESMKAGK